MADMFSAGLTRVGLSFHQLRVLLGAQVGGLGGSDGGGERCMPLYHACLSPPHRQLPRLAGHLSAHGVLPDMFSAGTCISRAWGYSSGNACVMHLPPTHTNTRPPAGWVMTLFTSLETLPVAYVAPTLGLFILDGWKALFRTAVAILETLQVRES